MNEILDFSSLYDWLDMGILITDETLNILFVNDWVKKRLPEELQDIKNISELYKDHKPLLIQSIVSKTIHYKSPNILSQAFHSWIIPLPDERFSDGLMRQAGIITPFLYKNQIYALIQIKDNSDTVLRIENLKLAHKKFINERRRVENILRKSNEELESQVEMRTRELITANDKLKKEMEEREKAEAVLKERQIQLIHAGRLASLGEMATGVAHELNQPLSIIRLKAELLRLWLKKAEYLLPDFDNCLKSILNSVDRATDIIKHMRNFARAWGGENEEINLTEPISKSLDFFKEQFCRNKILLEKDYEENLPKVKVDSRRFEQIMVNFLSNARYAVDKRGEQEGKDYKKKITLRVFHDKLENSVICEIIDNGVGMTSEEKERCIDPFFTTKKVDEGTGLGLSIIHGIIKDFGGKLEIESEKNEETVMRVVIPN